MSAIPFDKYGGERPGSWPTAAASGAPMASIRHLIDLARFFPAEGMAWPDALAVETRTHLAGCVAAIDTLFRSALAKTAVASALPALDAGVAWQTLRQSPHILSAPLLSHMRLRAATSLLSRRGLRSVGDPAAPAREGSAWLFEDSDPRLVEAALGLARGEALWSVAGEDASVAALDLPAEHFSELLWTVAAVLATEISRSPFVGGASAIAAVADAASDLLADYDEEGGAIGLATMLVRLLRGRDELPRLLAQALNERRYLLFAAIAAEMTGTTAEAMLDTLVHGSNKRLAALCRALEGAPSDFRHLLVDLAPVRGEVDDATLVALSDAYDIMDGEEIAAEIEALRRPAPLRAKLAQLAPAARA